ncbi:MAG: TorD/DmsD family molecular chaperone [Magnetospiraceae bacterium]
MSQSATAVPEEDVLRGRFYEFLSTLLVRAPEKSALMSLSEMHGDTATPLGQALSHLAEKAAVAHPDTVSDEFDALFIGITKGELVPYGSYYVTGFLNEKPLAELRTSMQSLGLERSAEVSEPEDHIASVLEIMGSLIIGRYGTPADMATQRRFFETHVAPWATAFFEDLEIAEKGDFYKVVGTIGRQFMAIEKDAFALA